MRTADLVDGALADLELDALAAARGGAGGVGHGALEVGVEPHELGRLVLLREAVARGDGAHVGGCAARYQE